MTKYKEQVTLRENERIDDLQRNGYGIIQRSDGFCFGMDAVLLSGFAKVKTGGIAVDLGTGTGIIPILLEAKTKGRDFYGVEIQPEIADMAMRSVKLNALEEKVHIICGDLRDISGRIAGKESCEKKQEETVRGDYDRDSSSEGCGGEVTGGTIGTVASDAGMPELKTLCGRIDTVTSNPPYMKAGSGIQNPDDIKLISRHEVSCNLREVCTAAARLLKEGGHFYMVHRPLRLPEIISELKNARLEPKRIKPVYPYIDSEANMILIDAVKGGAGECRFEKPIIVYKEQGVYTDEIYDIYGY